VQPGGLRPPHDLAVGVGLRWPLQFIVGRFQAAPEHLYVESPGGTPAVIVQRLEAEVDELWGFVGRKANRQWGWMAMGATTRQVIAGHVGDRSGQSAEALWERIPAVDQERALSYTDKDAVSTGVIPSAQPRPIVKLARKANHVECARRYRSSRGSAITWEPSASSFATTISPSVQHHQDSITQSRTKHSVLRASSVRVRVPCSS
jgi:IS1 family transposase